MPTSIEDIQAAFKKTEFDGVKMLKDKEVVAYLMERAPPTTDLGLPYFIAFAEVMTHAFREGVKSAAKHLIPLIEPKSDAEDEDANVH